MSEVLSTLIEAQKTLTQGCGFGEFLEMKSLIVKSTMLGYLLQNVNTEASTITFHGRTFKLTKDLYELITGLKDGIEEVVPHDEEVSPIRDAILGGRLRIYVGGLIKQIKASKDADDMFVILVVLLILGTVLVSTSGEYVSQEYVSVLSDVRRICKRSWASFTLNFLLEQIKGFHKRETKYMPRCTMFLQVKLND